MELKEKLYNIFNNQIVGGSSLLIKGESIVLKFKEYPKLVSVPRYQILKN